MVGQKPITIGEFLHFVGLWFLMATIIGPQQSNFWALTQLRLFMEHHIILGVECLKIVLM